MILHVNTRSDGLEPAGNHRAARLRRSAAAVPEARAPGPFGSKIFISERTGCYGPLPVLARHGRNGGARRPTRSATWWARSARSWRASLPYLGGAVMPQVRVLRRGRIRLGAGLCPRWPARM